MVVGAGGVVGVVNVVGDTEASRALECAGVVVAVEDAAADAVPVGG